MRNDAITLPELTHLQYLFLRQFPPQPASMSAYELQTSLEGAGYCYSGAKLYRALKRLVEAGYLIRRSRSVYSVSDAGQRGIVASCNFYKGGESMPP